MKLHVERAVLADAVEWAARAVPSRPVAPVMAGMRLRAANDDLAVSGFDYETSAQANAPVALDEPGNVIVAGRIFTEIVKSLPNKPVELTTDSTRMTVQCGTAVFTLMLYPQDDYPTLPSMPTVAGTAGADLFATAARQTTIAVSKDDTPPALTAVLIEFNDSLITMVGTDRYRLAVRTIPWTPAGTIPAGTDVLVPAKILADTARALTASAEVTIGLDATENGGVIGFAGKDRTTTTRLLGGEYMRWTSVVPDGFTGAAETETGPFAEAVKRVALVALPNVPVLLSFRPGEILIEAGSGDESQGSEIIPAVYDGDPVQVAFSPGYLLDGIGAAGIDGSVRMSLTTDRKPAVLTTPGDDQPGYRYVLVPVRTK